MPGSSNHGRGGGGLYDCPKVHDHDAVTDVFDDGEVMRDEQVGNPVLMAKVAEEINYLRLHRHVQRTDGLVADDECRLHG